MQGSTIPFRPVEIQLDANTFSIAPGGSTPIPFALINHTVSEDYFDITIQGIPANWVLLDMPVLHLGSGERRESSLTIQAPDNSPISAGEYPVVLRATSQSNREVWGEAGFELRVGGYESTMQAIPYVTEGRVGVSLNTVQFSVTPGETLSIPVLISNRGMYVDTFYLTMDGTPAAWASGPAQSVQLSPGESREVILLIQPPVGPESRAGRHPFRLRVTSQADPAQYTVVDALLTVAAVSQFASDLSPRHIDAGRTARIRIHNLSNIQGTYTVRFQSTQGELEFVPANRGPMRAMPGETVVLDFVVSPRSPNWFGRPTTLLYSVVVQSAEGETQVNHGDMINRSLIPVWVLPALAVFCLTSACGLGFLWNWNQSRLAGAKATGEVVGLINAQTATAGVFSTATSAAAGTATTSAAAALAEASAAAATATGQAAMTAAAIAGQPSPTPQPTATFTVTPMATFTPIPPTQTFTPIPPTLTPMPTSTFTAPPPTMTFTPTPTFTFTPAPIIITPTVVTPTVGTPTVLVTTTTTVLPLPVTGQQQFVFVSDSSGGPALYLFKTGDGTTKPLSSGSGADFDPAWSQDGKRIVFTSTRDGNDEIYVMNADGSNLVNLTKKPSDDRYPVWSPDGKQIAFTTNRDGNNEIYVMNADGSNLVNLTKSPANDFKPAWYTQSGLLSSTSRILFTTDRDGNQEIYAMNLDGSNPANLTKNAADDALPAVPFGGGKMAFVSNRDGNNEIYVMNLDGSSPANLTKNPADDNMPAWSPDGKWIAFTTNRDGNQEIYIMGADGKQVTNVTRSPANDSQPAWH
jgi:hypothetical protein